MEGKIVQYLIAFSLSICSASIGTIITWPASVLNKFHDNQTSFDITDNDISWMVSSGSPGFMIGSLLLRVTLDRFGRRTTILACIAPNAIGVVILLYARTGWLLCLSRFLNGFSNGLFICGTSIYFVEIAEKDIRGSVSVVTRFMTSFGSLFTMVIGPLVSYDTLNRILVILPFLSLAACWWIPESPYYHLKNGEVESARRVLMKIRSKDATDLDEELLQMKTQVNLEMQHSSSLKELLTEKRYRKALFISLGLKITQMLTGVLVIQHYFGLIVEESHLNLQVSTVLIIFGVVNFAVGVLSSAILDRIGRRPLLFYTFMGTGISLGTICFYFFMKDIVGIKNELLQPFTFVPFTGIIISTVLSNLGYNPLTNIVSAEVFPINVKTVATVVLHIVGGSVNTTTARSYKLIKDFAGLSGVFGVYTAASIAGAILSILLVPETKGKSLKEIQAELQGDLYAPEEISKEEVDLLNNGEIMSTVKIKKEVACLRTDTV